MHSEIQIFPRSGDEIQRVQLIRLEDWSQLDFLSPAPSDRAFESFCNIYRQYLVPGFPWVFGNIVLFRLPEGLPVPFSHHSKKYGTVSDPLTAAAIALKHGIRVRGGKILFRNKLVKAFCETLQQKNCLQLVRGKLPVTTVIPVGNTPGFLSDTEPHAQVKVNSSFFIMDPFDCATAYDHVGTSIGLCVKNGCIQNPPLFSREALLVRQDGKVFIDKPDIRKLTMEIGAQRYTHGQNAVIYSRPERAVTPGGKGLRLVIVGRQVAAVCSGGKVPIPASGFVLCPQVPCSAKAGDSVTYHGMEDIQFGIQAGNSIVRDGEKTLCFRSRFYNIRRLERVPFPPCLYPLDFENARAARIALGADADGKPILLWAEGAAKQGHVPGKDSCGASLSEMAQICTAVGMANAVNLDGGGSAQMLLHGKRTLRISDRDPQTFSDAERPIPAGLMVQSPYIKSGPA